jgi:carboxyl-terminal processing protease
LIQRDYSGSTFEYYYTNPPETAKINDKEREIKYTDGNRKVYGGGGITPDIIEPTRELNRFEMLLASKDAFFLYARRLSSGEVPAAGNFLLPAKNIERSDPSERIGQSERTTKPVPSLEITDAILADFKKFLREDRHIDFTNEDIQNNLDFIKRRIKQEVYTSNYGIQEGFKVGIQGDIQVLKALEMIPEAKSLMTSGRLAPTAQNPSK